jgi:hypothetical protein
MLLFIVKEYFSKEIFLKKEIVVQNLDFKNLVFPLGFMITLSHQES